ncbi:MAG: DUF484 family protein [Gammaproteobacteria bacterium]|jgi:uncharacterized protein YigA (DUF484 family)|nr:DUF484 family protein [Gammaproteobacteria bacterium]
MTTTSTEPATALSPEMVEEYLRSHTDFFHGRDELLRMLSVPHAANGAVSLVERQIVLLREQNRNYRRQLQDLVEVARDNERLLGRLQRLTLRLLDAEALNELLATLEDSLRADFHADAACLYLTGADLPEWQPNGAFLQKRIASTEAGAELARLLKGGSPVCGRLRDDQLGELFGASAASVGSVALLPLITGGRSLGGLAIGSHSADRFNAEMGTAYLDHLAELIAHRIAPFLHETAPQIA